MSQSHIVTKSHLQAVFSSALPRIRNKSGSKITGICPVNYVRREIVQTVLKIGPYRQPKFGVARERQYLCLVSPNSSNYAVKLLVKCRQTIRNTETRKIEPKTMKHSYSKSELATMAGVSYSTFYRYLKTRRSRFDQMGLSIYAKKLLFLHSPLTTHQRTINVPYVSLSSWPGASRTGVAFRLRALPGRLVERRTALEPEGVEKRRGGTAIV